MTDDKLIHDRERAGRSWYIGVRDIANATDYRTTIATILPADTVASHGIGVIDVMNPLTRGETNALKRAVEKGIKEAEEDRLQREIQPSLFDD